MIMWEYVVNMVVWRFFVGDAFGFGLWSSVKLEFEIKKFVLGVPWNHGITKWRKVCRSQ